MALAMQVTFDAADPGALAAFWTPRRARLREEAERHVAAGGTKLYEFEERGSSGSRCRIRRATSSA
jgi:hypothetical protein